MATRPPRARRPLPRRRTRHAPGRRGPARAAVAALLATGLAAAASTTGADARSLHPRPLSPRPPTTRVLSVSPDRAMALEVIRLTNVERVKAGCTAAHEVAALSTAARLHSADMAAQDYFSHTSLDGRSPWDRIEAQGYLYGSAENIAAGQQTPSAVVTAWMNSSGHRANILACANVAIGVGVGHGGTYGIYWTQDFGRT
jgi:uncharacterized protein YkwD